MSLTESQLRQVVDKAKRGDLGAFDRLVGHFQDAVCGAAYAVLGSFDDAQDIAQEVFVQAWRDLGALRDNAKFPGWLHRITENRCRDFLRRLRPQSLCGEVSPETLSSGNDADPADEIVRRESNRRTLTAIGGLSQANRATTMLFYIDGYLIREIAEFLDVPVGTVKRRLHESRKQLTGSVTQMMRESLEAQKPGPELRANITAELARRQEQFDYMVGRVTTDDQAQWARQRHELRLADVRANAAQYGIEPDEDLPRMLPEYYMSMTFRDDFQDLPQRWGVPEAIDLTNLRDLGRVLKISPLSVHRWEQEGLPSLRYHPWTLYDRHRVTQWIGANQPTAIQEMDAEQSRQPLLVVLGGIVAGLATPEEGVQVCRKLSVGSEFLLGPRDPLWAEQWDKAHETERQANANAYGLEQPTPKDVGWLPFGIAPEDHSCVFEIRDLCRRLGISPIDAVRWTREGMPCLRYSPWVRWDIRRVREWIAQQGIMPTGFTPEDLDDIELFVCRAVSNGGATPEEGHEVLSGWVGIL